MMGQISTWFKHYSLALVWLMFLAWMCHDYWIAHPPVLGAGHEPNQIGELQRHAFNELEQLEELGAGRHGPNQVGELQLNAKFLLLEIGILYAILRPWSASSRSLKRFVVAFGLFFYWLCWFFLLTIRAGNVSKIHAFWLVFVNFGLFLASAISFAAWEED